MNSSFLMEGHTLLEHIVRHINMLNTVDLDFECPCTYFGLCDLNAPVRGRVSSSRTRFWTQPTVKSAVSKGYGYSR